MQTGQLVGVLLIVCAGIDVVLGYMVVGPRITDPGRRRIVQLSLVAGAGILAVLGILFLARVIGAAAVA